MRGKKMGASKQASLRILFFMLPVLEWKIYAHQVQCGPGKRTKKQHHKQQMLWNAEHEATFKQDLHRTWYSGNEVIGTGVMVKWLGLFYLPTHLQSTHMKLKDN